MQKRIIFAVTLSILLILVALGFISYRSVNESIGNIRHDQLALAGMMRNSLEQTLENNLARLYDLSQYEGINLDDTDLRPERAALRWVHRYSLFDDGVFLLDRRGRVAASFPFPERSLEQFVDEPFQRVMRMQRPVITDVQTVAPTGRKVIVVLVPLRDADGVLMGAAGGAMNPTSYLFTQIMRSLPADDHTILELVDSEGIVIASSAPARLLTGSDHNRFLSSLIEQRRSSVVMCHRCHDERGGARTRDVLAFAPLSVAPWGVAVRVSEDIVFASSRRLLRGFVVLGVIAVAAALALTAGMIRSIVRPVRQLIREVQKVERGNLSEPVSIPGGDEVGILARRFDRMRQELAKSIDSIRRHSDELEQRVQERTAQLMEKQLKNKLLLRKVISSQEDERKRIAREMHDDTLQALSAVLMNIEMCRQHPEQITFEKIDRIRSIVHDIINGMNRLVQNLRPTVLDDLGFEAAVVWVLDRHLRDRGIAVHLNMKDFGDVQLLPEVEITLFRIIQEASMNIARHAGAENAFVTVRQQGNELMVSIEDDGKGFDTATVFAGTLTGRGLGIMGMKERAALLNGRLTVCSAPDAGTMVLCTIPLAAEA